MAIKVNLLRREAPKRAASGLPAISLPKISIGGGRAIQAAGAALALVVVVFLVLGFQAWSQKHEHAKAVTQLKARNAALQQQLAELRTVEEAKREIQRRLDIIGRVAKAQKIPMEMMTGVLKSVPAGIWLTSFDVRPQEGRVRVELARPPISGEALAKLAAKREEAGAGRPAARPGVPGPTREVTEVQGYSVVIKGMAFNNFQVAEFMENLRKAGVFSDVDFTVTQAANVEQVRVMDFELTANVKL